MKRFASVLPAVAAILAMAAGVVIAQTLPVENHYKVYQSTAQSIVRPVTLIDEFGILADSVFTFDKFATPAQKILSDGTVYGIVDPDIHQSWWHLAAPQPQRTVVATDQFGTYAWTLQEADYLLLPALKNVPKDTPLPVWNHYLCYGGKGPIYSIPVTLVDQFGSAQVVVLKGVYFCNPTEKIEGGITYPIVDPAAHLTCYTVQAPVSHSMTVDVLDQFHYKPTTILNTELLCLPCLRQSTVRTQNSTWGRIKALYR
jgi:hypothetical protein